MASVPDSKIPDLSSDMIKDATNSQSDPATKEALAKVKCLFFDVFGTCVDWRKSITDVMYNAAHQSLNSAEMSLSSRIRVKASNMVCLSALLLELQSNLVRRTKNGAS